MSICLCYLCKRDKEWNAILATGDMDLIQQMIRDLRNMLAESEADNDYYKAVMDGSWPSARQQLTHALSRCPPEKPYEAVQMEKVETERTATQPAEST